MIPRLAARARNLRRGPSFFLDPTTTALNFSYVLHERAASDAVRSHVRRAAAHAASISRQPEPAWLKSRIIALDEFIDLAPAVVLSAAIGVPRILSDLLPALSTQPTLLLVDAAAAELSDVTFFRASARLRLPEYDIPRLAVAAAIVRPGGSSTDLVSYGPFRWPDERGETIRALEDLFRAHVAQWMPPRALWGAPADEVLPPEEFE